MRKIRNHNRTIKVIQVREFTDYTYAIRLERNDFDFKAGQHITLGPLQGIDSREYSIYSGENDDFIEVLIREVEKGNISRKLKRVQTGDLLQMDGPVGYFTLNEEQLTDKVVFLASGTGIAPFHSFIKSYPTLDYTLLHGVRLATESYGKADYDPERYILCTSQDTNGNFNGRITQYLQENILDTTASYYLCGNINMIYDSFDILQLKGVPANRVHAEVYF